MPKKFMGENSKATAAKEKKLKAKEEISNKKKQEIEDEKWKEESKILGRKNKRKEDEEKKRQEQLKRKAELKEILKKETESITKAKVQKTTKVTKAQIDKTEMQKSALKDSLNAKNNETHLTSSLIENVNRLSLEEEIASTIDAALLLLNDEKQVVDRHPEKRLKAAYKAFEEKRLKELKPANPFLKLSQLKQMVFKEWQKIQGESR